MNAPTMEWVSIATTAFLVVFFVLAEFRRARRAVRGVFRGYLADPSPAAAMLLRRARVELAGGRTVEAVVSGCVLCQGALRDGDAVDLNRVRGGYEVAAGGTTRPPACFDRLSTNGFPLFRKKDRSEGPFVLSEVEAHGAPLFHEKDRSEGPFVLSEVEARGGRR